MRPPRACSTKGGVTKASAGGYGEIYKAASKILAKTLFKAKLLPPGNGAQHRSGRIRPASKKVNHNLALKCWKNDGCSTGTDGKLTVAYVEPFGENAIARSRRWSSSSRRSRIKIGRIIYRSAHSDLTQALTDFRAVIAQR